MKKYYIAVLAAVLTLTACRQAPADSPSAAPTAPPATTTNKPSSAPTTSAMETSGTEIETSAIEASSPTGFIFTLSDGTKLYMHEEASSVLAALGDPLTFLEAPSCAFQGTDRIYGYGSFELTTYEKDGKEYIYDIYFLDDSITTDEGIYLGCTKADMEASYGTDYTEEASSYTYTKDGMTLQFLTERDTIIAIRYNGAGQTNTP